MRQSVLSSVLAVLKPGAHISWLYETATQHLELLDLLLQHCMSRNLKVLLLVDDYTSPEMLRHLEAGRISDRMCTQKGQLCTLGVENGFSQGRSFDPAKMILLLQTEAERAVAEGFSALFVTGEMTWALRKLSNTRLLIEYEAKLNELFASTKCLAVCQYDRKSCNPELLLDVLATHPVVIDGTDVYENPYYMPTQKFLKLEKSEIELHSKLMNLAQQARTKEALQKSEDRLSSLIEENEMLRRKIEEQKRVEIVLQNSELRFRTIFEGASVGMAFINLHGRLLMSNSSLQNMLGYRAKELSRMIFTEIIHPDDKEKNISFFQELICGTRDHYQMEVRHLSKDGTCAWANLIVTLIRGRTGKPKFAIAMVHDITKRKQAEAEIKSSHAQLRNLSAHLQSAIEAERKQIAREIHDELGQTLTALKLDLAWLGKRLPEEYPDLHVQTNSLSALVDGTIQKVKTIATELRPGVLDNLGLTAAIEWQTEELRKRTGLNCQVHFEPSEIKLDSNRSIDIFRILQESLTNIVRHAQAANANVSLKKNGKHLHIEISDDGIGIKEEQIDDLRSIGLIGMRERVHSWGGEITITGRPQQGTTITVTIPLNGVSREGIKRS